MSAVVFLMFCCCPDWFCIMLRIPFNSQGNLYLTRTYSKLVPKTLWVLFCFFFSSNFEIRTKINWEGGRRTEMLNVADLQGTRWIKTRWIKTINVFTISQKHRVEPLPWVDSADWALGLVAGMDSCQTLKLMDHIECADLLGAWKLRVIIMSQVQNMFLKRDFTMLGDS